MPRLCLDQSAEPIWASGHPRPQSKTGHMTARNPIQKINVEALRARGRPHMTQIAYSLARMLGLRDDAGATSVLGGTSTRTVLVEPEAPGKSLNNASMM